LAAGTDQGHATRDARCDRLALQQHRHAVEPHARTGGGAHAGGRRATRQGHATAADPGPGRKARAGIAIRAERLQAGARRLRSGEVQHRAEFRQREPGDPGGRARAAEQAEEGAAARAGVHRLARGRGRPAIPLRAVDRSTRALPGRPGAWPGYPRAGPDESPAAANGERMSAAAGDTTRDTTLSAEEGELREALIAYCRLTPEAVEQIDETMRGTQLSFCDAAVHVGLVTEGEAAQAQAWVHAAISRRNSSIVETALRRHGSTKSIAVRHSLMGRPGNRLQAACDADNPHAEQLRALRTELLLLAEGGRDASCLAIISPCSHEGRSQLAAELAVAFSQLGQRTLLIDADLRRPTLHSLFGVEVQWGLAQSLAFGEPPHLIGVEGLPFLTVLPAGPRVSNPLELLSG